MNRDHPPLPSGEGCTKRAQNRVSLPLVWGEVQAYYANNNNDLGGVYSAAIAGLASCAASAALASHSFFMPPPSPRDRLSGGIIYKKPTLRCCGPATAGQNPTRSALSGQWRLCLDGRSTLWNIHARARALVNGVTVKMGATHRRFAAISHGLEKVALREGLKKAYAAFLTDAVRER